jgi:Porin PorA
MTRHVSGLIAAGLAACFAASAVILGWRAAGQAAEAPLREQVTATLTAAHASYFSPTRLTEIAGANIEVTEVITGATSAVYPGIAIWDVFRSVVDTTNHQRLEPMSRTLVFDPKTAELINCCGESINGNGLIQQSGIAGYVFPAGTRKQTYAVFDAVLDQPEPFAYSGTDVVDGIPAYRFAENISGGFAGFSPLSSAHPELYSMRRVYWVDPETGAVLKVTEDEDLFLVNPATGLAVTQLFDANLSTTQATVARLASRDARARNEIALVGTVRSLSFCLAGASAVTATFLLARKPRLRLLRRVSRGGQ